MMLSAGAAGLGSRIGRVIASGFSLGWSLSPRLPRAAANRPALALDFAWLRLEAWVRLAILLRSAVTLAPNSSGIENSPKRFCQKLMPEARSRALMTERFEALAICWPV